MARIITGRFPDVWEWLKRSGLVDPDSHVTRVIIDIGLHDVIKVYIEEYADERAFVTVPPQVVVMRPPEEKKEEGCQ